MAAMTLIEVLIVFTIMGILFSILSGVMLIAQRQGKGTNTRATLMKVDQAIRLFRTDMRVYPWQVDLGAPPAEPTQWGNDLATRLAWSPSAADRITFIRDFHADVAAIERRFRFVNGRNVPPSGDSSEGSHAFRLETQTASSRTNLLLGPGSLRHSIANVSSTRWVPGTPSRGNDSTGDAKALTKMAEEVTTLAYVAGQMPTQAPTGIDATLAEDKARFPNEDERYPNVSIGGSPALPFRYFPYNKAGHYGDDSRGPVLTSATARTNGWRGDYLADALRTTGGGHLDVDASGTAIVDAWDRPLIYVCTVRPGVRGFMHGLTTNIFSGAREDRYNMGPQGREITDLLASDIRTTAGVAYIYEFELWSSGPDKLFFAARDNPVNRDNIALLPYTKGLR